MPLPRFTPSPDTCVTNRFLSLKTALNALFFAKSLQINDRLI
jgi:hypothetical protein